MKTLIQEYCSMCNLLDSLLILEQKKLRSWEKELAKLPDGSLYSSVRSSGVYYYQIADRRKHGITRDMDLVYDLARKKYLEAKIREHREEFRRIGTRMLNNATRSAKASNRAKATKTSKSTPPEPRQSTIEKLLAYYGKLGLDILRITCSRQQYLWTRGNYPRNTMNPEQLKYETYSGIKVRSKSEQAIGNKLELNGIPYRYEQALEFDVSWMEGVKGSNMGMYKIYYPDFTILTFSGDYIIWEHLGRVDQEGYRGHNMEKLSAYRHSGKIPDSRLVITFEKDLERKGLLNEIVEMRVLPYVG